MQTQTGRQPSECVRIFQESIKKRPMKLKPFPFKCDSPQIAGDTATVSASFKIAEPYGTVRMQCHHQAGVTLINFYTDGNIRGKITANSMAKHIASKLSP